MLRDTYPINCFNCLSEYEAVEAIWCSCNPQRPTKVCPFCLGCFCAAGDPFKESFWRDAPESLRKEIDTLSQSRMLLGEMLVKSGMITTPQLLDALNRQKSDGRRIGEILVDTGALTTERLEQFLKSQHTVTTIDVSRARVDAMMIRKLGVERCLEAKILPLEAEAFRDRHIMTLAMADPSNAAEVERVMQATGYQVIPGVATAEAITAVIRSIFPPGSATAPQPSLQPMAPVAADPACAEILKRALQRRASHVRLRKDAGATRVFYRIDGALYQERAGGGADPAAALAGFKLVAGLETRAGDCDRAGRALVNVEGCEYQVIVKLRQGPEGDELTVKLLDPMTFPPRLDDLGLPSEINDRLHRFLDLDSGLLVVSAPPLSGASSTFYAIATEVIAQGRALALVESPRCVNLTDATQEEFFPELPGSFTESLARAVSSGAGTLAISASEGFDWSAQAAALCERLLVICKVESRSLPDAMLRLVAAGYPASSVGRRPTLVLHQRLVRRICQACRTEVSNAEPLASSLRIDPAQAREIGLWRGIGCDECRLTPGYKGRLPLVQAVRADVAVGAAVEAAATRGAGESLMAACRAAGMTSMRGEALAALAAGLTTHEEITGKQAL